MTKLHLVEVSAEAYADLVSELQVVNQLDVGSAIAVSGHHPDLGGLIGFNPSAGNSIIVLPEEFVAPLKSRFSLPH